MVMVRRHVRMAGMLGLWVGTLTGSAWGLSETTQVTPMAADAWPLMPMQFGVKAEKKADGVHIVVTIVPHEGVKFYPVVEGRLAIMEGATPVAAMPVAIVRTE